MEPIATMPPKNLLTQAPPIAVEEALRTLGANLRVARIRRKITLAEMAARLGVGRHVVADAEVGKLTTGIVVYAGMLWSMNLLDGLSALASPNTDEEGLALARHSEPVRARPGGGLSDDF
jgi:hypothetical protein